MAKVRVFSEKTFVCAKCGMSFIALRKHELCPVCNDEKRKAYQKSYVRKENRGKPVVQKSENKKDKTDNPVETKREKKLTHCKFCGKLTTIGDFCRNCKNEGFDNVFRLTGRSNGWDRVKRKRISVVSGWRGQHCVGTFSGRNWATY